MNPLLKPIAPLAALLLAACAGAPSIERASPAAAAAGEVLAMSLSATGAHTYECRPAPTGARSEWAFVRLSADLIDAHGRPVRYREGSPVVGRPSLHPALLGQVRTESDWPSARDVPWLFLEPDAGQFWPGRVAAIQRLHNAHGVAPGAPCAPDQLGRQVQVAYSADYRFFADR